MKSPVKLLIVENDESDLEILKRLLERSGLDIEPIVADELPEILGILDKQELDAILTDHQLASFTASEVLLEVSGRMIDIPVIVVSGAVGEDRAADLMRKGAADFIRKDNISRLIPALTREIRECESRRNLRKASESRARTEAMLRLVVDLSGDSFWEWDLDTGRLDWSDTFSAMCGENPRVAPHIDAWRERLHPEERAQVVDGIDGAIRSGGSLWSGNFRFLRGDGGWALLAARCFVVRKDGLPVRVITAMTDITERQALIERQRVFTELVDQAMEAVVVVDPVDGRFLEFNRMTYVPLGYSEQEFANLTLFDIDCQHGADEMRELLKKFKEAEVRELSSRHRCKDGRVRHVRINARPICLEGRLYVSIWWLDLTERVAIEAELRQSQKMELLGQIAGGVSHDFNNILAVMRMQLDIAQMKPPEPGELQTLVQTLSEMVDRASNLTRHLLHLSRKEKAKPETFELDPALDDLVTVIRRILGTRIEVRRIPCAENPFILADRSIMEQVFMNLIVNARDAMPNGGVLTIETVLSGDQQGGGDDDGAQGKRFVVVRVSDTGIGMSKETIAKIEKPFFTTKEPGKGTGLGVSTVRRCLREHGGWLTVESELGRGSVFGVHLPLAEAGTSGAGPTKPKDPRRPACVLMMMKDSQLRMLARKTLENIGCSVRVCANPVELSQAVESKAEDFDLILVPAGRQTEVQGEGLANWVRTRLPSVPMIVTQSPSDDAEDLPSGEVEVLDLPFSINDLIALVKGSLPDHDIKRPRP